MTMPDTPQAAAPEISDAPVQFTPKAIEMAKQKLDKAGLSGWALRVGVVGGGCSGLSYSMNFDEHAKADDTVYVVDGLRVLVDEMSLQYLRGMTVDYVSGLHGAGFKFLNPNANRTCGCGSSFAV
jgi:iron-sulfur cluster assembly accessory protein